MMLVFGFNFSVASPLEKFSADTLAYPPPPPILEDHLNPKLMFIAQF